MWGRDGSISFIRIGTIVVVIGILIVVGGVGLFFVDRATHQRPYEIDPYPGSTIWFTTSRGSNARQVVYRVPAVTAEDVVNYYQNKLNALSGNSGEKCIRFPSTGKYDGYEKDKKTSPPYRFSCMFDRSGFQISQYTRVNIEPGVEANNSVGMVVIENEQYWQR